MVISLFDVPPLYIGINNTPIGANAWSEKEKRINHDQCHDDLVPLVIELLNDKVIGRKCTNQKLWQATGC